MAKKLDIVLEAVRYKNGQILAARGYERRGAVFSDRLLFERKMIAEQIRNKKIVVTGRRRELLAGTFEIGRPVKLAVQDGREMIVTGDGASQDELEGVPVF